jgi:hypothetical protein
MDLIYFRNLGDLNKIKIQLAKTSNHLAFLMKCKIHIFPKDLTLEAPYHSYRFKITLRASMVLVREREKNPEIGTSSYRLSTSE